MGPQVSHQVAQGAAKDTHGTPKHLTKTSQSTPKDAMATPKTSEEQLQDPQGPPKEPPSTAQDGTRAAKPPREPPEQFQIHLKDPQAVNIHEKDRKWSNKKWKYTKQIYKY